MRIFRHCSSFQRQSTETPLLRTEPATIMCFYCVKVKVSGPWSLHQWERFHSILYDHFCQEGITFWFHPMCKFEAGFKLLCKLMDAQKLTDDPRLVTQQMWSLMCYLSEGWRSIQKLTQRVMDWYCPGGNIPLEGINNKGLDYKSMKEKGFEDRIVWLPIWEKYIFGPQNQIKGPQKEKPVPEEVTEPEEVSTHSRTRRSTYTRSRNSTSQQSSPYNWSTWREVPAKILWLVHKVLLQEEEQ